MGNCTSNTPLKPTVGRGSAHLHLSHFIDDAALGFCVELGVFFAVWKELHQVQHEVTEPAGGKEVLMGFERNACVM